MDDFISFSATAAETAHVTVKRIQPHILSWIDVWSLTQSPQNVNIVVLKPFGRNFVCTLGAIVLLENTSSVKSYFSCRLH